MDKKSDENLAEKMHHDAAEMRSNAVSDFMQADLADFKNEQQQENQPNSSQQQNLPLDSSQSSINTDEDHWMCIQTELIKSQLIAFQNNLLKVNLESMKLEWMRERENDKKQIDELKHELMASRERMAKAEENTDKKCEKMEREMVANQRKMEEKFADAMREMQRKLDESAAVGANKQFEQLKKDSHEKLEEANKRAEEQKTAHQQQIDQLKCDLMACQQQMAELVKMSGKNWRLCNPKLNKWEETDETLAIIIENGLIVTGKEGSFGGTFFAVLPFSFADSPFDTLGIQLNYYEVKFETGGSYVGLSADNSRRGEWVGDYAHSYSITVGNFHSYHFSDTKKQFEWPSGADKPIYNRGWGESNVIGCGVLNWPNHTKRAIFFTTNGTLLGKPIPVPADVPLYPAVSLVPSTTLEANFGDDPAVPFRYDVVNCPGLNIGSG